MQFGDKFYYQTTPQNGGLLTEMYISKLPPMAASFKERTAPMTGKSWQPSHELPGRYTDIKQLKEREGRGESY